MQVTFNLESLLQKLMNSSVELPAILEQAAASGVYIPPQLIKGLPYLGLLAQVANKFVTIGPDDGLSPKGLNTGPQGRGRMSYLRRREQWSDGDVVQAVQLITDPQLGLASGKQVVDLVNYTMSCMFPGGDQQSDANARKAIDQILDADGLPPGVCDKFGDLLYHCLSNGMTKAKTVT